MKREGISRFNPKEFRCIIFSSMKRFLLLLFCVAAAIAQPAQVTLPQPDCTIIVNNFTTLNQTAPLSPNAGFNNMQGGCNTWAMSISVSGFSSVTVALQSAPNNAGVAGTWVTFAGQKIFSSSPNNVNPIITGTQQFVWLTGYNPWVRVALTAVSGTGVVNGTAYGWRIPSASSGQ